MPVPLYQHAHYCLDDRLLDQAEVRLEDRGRQLGRGANKVAVLLIKVLFHAQSSSFLALTTDQMYAAGQNKVGVLLMLLYFRRNRHAAFRAKVLRAALMPRRYFTWRAAHSSVKWAGAPIALPKRRIISPAQSIKH